MGLHLSDLDRGSHSLLDHGPSLPHQLEIKVFLYYGQNVESISQVRSSSLHLLQLFTLLERSFYMYSKHFLISIRFRIVSKTILVIISALFLDSIRRMYSVHLTIYQPDILKMGKQTEMNTVLVASQRNAFLTGLSVFLFLVIYRFQAMSDQVNNLDSILDLQRCRTYVTRIFTDFSGGLLARENEPIRRQTL